MTEVPEVDPDLVGAASKRAGFDEGRAIVVAPHHLKCRRGGSAILGVDLPTAQWAGFIADGGLAGESFPRWMPLHFGEVNFFHLAAGKLGLEAGGKGVGPRQNHQARGIGIQPVGGFGFLRMINRG
jgi:hypothetical protein